MSTTLFLVCEKPVYLRRVFSFSGMGIILKRGGLSTARGGAQFSSVPKTT